MSNFLNILSEETFADKMDTLNKLLAAIASNTGGMTIKSFADLQQLTRLGLASKVVSIGDQISCEKATSITAAVSGTGVTAATVDFEKFRKATKTTGGVYAFTYDGAWKLDGKAADIAAYGITVTGAPANGDTVTVTEKTETLVWAILDFDKDTPNDKKLTHTIALMLHDCSAKTQFDQKEAIYFASSALSAGTYNFTLPSDYESDGGGKTYQFTLANAVPKNGQIVFAWGNAQQAINSKISTFSAATSTTPIETVSVTEGSGGTALSPLNASPRIRYASNRYSQSSVRQKINSQKAGNAWWNAANNYDRPPADANKPGFLYGVEDDFINALCKVDKTCALNTVTDGGGSEIVSDYLFLPSQTEIYGGGSEGTAYELFSKFSDLSAPGIGNDANRIKHNNGAASIYWTRSVSPTTANGIISVRQAGNLLNLAANNEQGIAPICFIG